jgi:cysteine desulfuration protein SufE
MSPRGEAAAPGPPEPLARLADEVAALAHDERVEQLIDWADKFRPVPPGIARPPYPRQNRVPRCESEVSVFAVDREDGTLDFHFAVESAHALAAKAWAEVLTRTCSGQPLESVANVPDEVMLRIFGHDVSMGKGLGLAGMLDMVRRAARARLARRVAESMISMAESPRSDPG